jgi:hypothetical protein
VSPLVRRIAARAVLAAGAAAIAIMLARACDDGGTEEVTIVVDPSPLGSSVRAVRVDVFDHAGARGNVQRNFAPGETPEPVRLRVAAPGAGGEVVIEVERGSGAERVRRPLDAPPGATVRIVLGGE